VKEREAVHLLESLVESVIDYKRIPGMSIAIVHDQKLVYAKGFGYLDAERQVEATPGTIYSICSISKLFTGLAVLQLRDAGKLDLDDRVAKHLPWFAPEMVSAETQPPTLRDLLRHSSGLPCEPDKTVWSDPDQLYPSRDDLITRVSSLTMSYPANTKFNYSNLGYALLGEVVSVVSGLEYSDYVQKNILAPLGLERTTPYLPKDLLGSELAIGYGRWPRTGSRVRIDSSDPRSLTPARGFASTVEDLAKFAMWQFRVLDGKDEAVLSRETLIEMQTAEWSNPKWGLGFSIWHLGDRAIVGHQGGCPGYKSQIILCPEEKIAVVVMFNATDAPQRQVVFGAYQAMAPALLDHGDGSKEPMEWTKYIGYYTSDESWSDAEVLQWNGSLAVMWVSLSDPGGSLTMLKRVSGDVFREFDDNGELGKHYIFGTDARGNIVSMKFNNNLLKKTAR
jgi:CubicO group peptidase (beta-lactamase class C family)